MRICDLRRMIVPLTYFIEKPFQNWTYESTEQIGSVVLRVDYAVPVARLRQKLDEIVRESPLWDGRVAALQVTDATNEIVELRVLVSARSPGQTWDLRCYVREKLVEFLQAEYHRALPAQGSEVSSARRPPGEDAEDTDQEVDKLRRH